MKACGIIVEYNPFHNGHSYHLQQSKKQSESDIIVAVMSGNFLQRGEPAILSKWDRSRTALMGGADLVIELPYLFAVSPAPIFAQSSVFLLNEMGVDAICFGSESGNMDSFYHTISELEKNKTLYDQSFQSFIKQGYSFPKASSLAADSLMLSSNTLDLAKPNNILGIEYVKAILDQEFPIKPNTIKRIGAAYHEDQITAHKIASATAIRKTLFESENISTNEIKEAVPDYTRDILESHLQETGQFTTWESLYPILRYKLLSSTPEQLSELYETEEGLEHRLRSVISGANNFHEFMAALKTKRYTWTRLQRMCLHILHNIKKETAAEWVRKGPPYIRILGMSSEGQRYLRMRKKEVTVPIVTTVSQYSHPMLELEQRVSSIYYAGYPQAVLSKKIKEEYSTPPLRFDRSKGLFL
ncbi:nucleotidyltransferase [Fictibacillus sp. WQ 8-8]|uniref:nucleotidyltransferase n=1 Tax=Fictibacillus sp. WQ 8-8 TaxID=2938788 RepID=UPI00210A531B|nr:nucleotidyltransferase [Fictibacillus sp. WQ 8-8]MCQ6265679.1 nucleotidyltransferase [Fictibacillus sp. WQ 8-8]